MPPGMGNWDNSCYQNSVVQGLASLRPLQMFLASALLNFRGLLDDSTNSTLHETIGKLNDPENNGKMLWMPAKLKAMSTWQQQDAQEYFSKILDEVDKELLKVSRRRSVLPGLKEDGGVAEGQHDAESTTTLHNPMEGFLAQRVACTRCGHSEGLSMIPFNCLTVPLGKDWAYDIRDCLDEYTKLEVIEGVECAKCTLHRTIDQLETIKSRLSTDSAMNETLRQSISARLRAAEDALLAEDFTDKTLKNTCQISKNNWTCTTKSRQAVVGRAPKSLVIHVNRSVFNEMTGAQMKNYADVSFPSTLDLRPWCLGRPIEDIVDGKAEPKEAWSMDPNQSMLTHPNSELLPSSSPYELRAVVTHFGRHENGHYICYRKHASMVADDDEKQQPQERWWRLSDEDVYPVSEGDVLNQGGVFMLFYEQVPTSQAHNDEEVLQVAASIPLPAEVEEVELAELFEEPEAAEIERIAVPTEADTAIAAAKSKSRAALMDELRMVLPRPNAETELDTKGIGETATQPNVSTAADLEVEDSSTDQEEDGTAQDTAPYSVPSPAMRVRMRTSGLGNSLHSDDTLASPMRLASAF